MPEPTRRALIAYVPFLTHRKIRDQAGKAGLSTSEYLHSLIEAHLGIQSRGLVKHRKPARELKKTA